MAVKFTIPNSAEAVYAIQAQPDRGDFVALTASAQRTGVVSGLTITASGTADMMTHVGTGSYSLSSTIYNVASSVDLTHTTADPVLGRLDLIVGTASGVSLLTGVPASTPLYSVSYDPSVHVMLAAVFVPPSTIGLTVSHIIDKRIVYVPVVDQSDLSGAVATETEARISADSTLQTSITTNANNITSETLRATTQEALLAPKVSPTFSGTVTVPDPTTTSGVLNRGYADLRYDELGAATTAQSAAAVDATNKVTTETTARLNADVSIYQALASSPEILVVNVITRNTNDAITSAAVVWPDGTVGTYTALVLSSVFLGAVDSYQITYGSPVTKTFTQPTVTRSASGAVTNRPAITVVT